MRPAWIIFASLGVSGLALAQPAAWLEPFASAGHDGQARAAEPTRVEVAQSGSGPHTRVICVTPVRYRRPETNPRDGDRSARSNPVPLCEPAQGLIQPV